MTRSDTLAEFFLRLSSRDPQLCATHFSYVRKLEKYLILLSDWSVSVILQWLLSPSHWHFTLHDCSLQVTEISHAPFLSKSLTFHMPPWLLSPSHWYFTCPHDWFLQVTVRFHIAKVLQFLRRDIVFEPFLFCDQNIQLLIFIEWYWSHNIPRMILSHSSSNICHIQVQKLHIPSSVTVKLSMIHIYVATRKMLLFSKCLLCCF